MKLKKKKICYHFSHSKTLPGAFGSTRVLNVYDHWIDNDRVTIDSQTVNTVGSKERFDSHVDLPFFFFAIHLSGRKVSPSQSIDFVTVVRMHDEYFASNRDALPRVIQNWIFLGLCKLTFSCHVTTLFYGEGEVGLVSTVSIIINDLFYETDKIYCFFYYKPKSKNRPKCVITDEGWVRRAVVLARRAEFFYCHFREFSRYLATPRSSNLKIILKHFFLWVKKIK